tara:strand:+ start:198 stop:806 length:609 start_codon:yes stop_codon:yes gene_type:complete
MLDNIIKGHSFSLLPLSSIWEIFSITEGNILEIGCFEGRNLTDLSKQFPNRTIHGIDPFISDGKVPDYGLNKIDGMKQTRRLLHENIAGLDNVRFHEMKTSDFMSKFSKKEIVDLDIGVCIIDGYHTKEMAMIDFQLAEIALQLDDKKENATSKLLIIDDTSIPEIFEVFEYVNKKYEKIITQVIHTFSEGIPFHSSVVRFW